VYVIQIKLQVTKFPQKVTVFDAGASGQRRYNSATTQRATKLGGISGPPTGLSPFFFCAPLMVGDSSGPGYAGGGVKVLSTDSHRCSLSKFYTNKKCLNLQQLA